MSKKITMTETRLGSPHGYDVETFEKGVTYDTTDSLAATFITDGSAVEGDGASLDDDKATWPPTDEQLGDLNFAALGELLASQGVEIGPIKSKDDRRAAIRDLIAKQKADAAALSGDDKGDGASK